MARQRGEAHPGRGEARRGRGEARRERGETRRGRGAGTRDASREPSSSETKDPERRRHLLRGAP